MQSQVRHRIVLISVVLLSFNISVFLILLKILHTILKIDVVWIVLIIGCILTFIQIVLYIMMVKRRQQNLDMMTLKLEAIVNEKGVGNFLFEQGDPYYGLANAINKVQELEQNKVYWLRRREEELSNLVEYLPVGVLVVNHNRTIKVTNPMASQLLEVKLSVGRSLHMLVDHYALISLFQKAVNTHQNQREAVQIDTSEGIKHLEVTMIFHKTSKKHFQVIVLLYDLTEVMLLEQMQTDFLSNASHELKTPITAINGFVETLQMGAKDDPKVLTEFLDIIGNESKRLIDLVEDILSISRFSNDNVEDVDELNFSINDFLNDELVVMNKIADLKNVNLKNNTKNDFKVTSNKNYLTQVVKNLISNAIKYNNNGGTVIIDAHLNENDWQLVIKDNGIGIPQKQQNRVFERFYRGDASRTQKIAHGTGLGLAIVKELVTKLNGQISLYSQIGVGTTISIIFKNK